MRELKLAELALRAEEVVAEVLNRLVGRPVSVDALIRDVEEALLRGLGLKCHYVEGPHKLVVDAVWAFDEVRCEVGGELEELVYIEMIRQGVNDRWAIIDFGTEPEEVF